jgi:hypothetical protein
VGAVGKKMTAQDLAALIIQHRYCYDDAVTLQNGIKEMLLSHAIGYSRDVHLSLTDRPDLMVGGVAVEVRIGGLFASVLRQLTRYAQHEEVTGIVLVTCKASHRRMPKTLNGKPVVVVALLEGGILRCPASA